MVTTVSECDNSYVIPSLSDILVTQQKRQNAVFLLETASYCLYRVKLCKLTVLVLSTATASDSGTVHSAIAIKPLTDFGTFHQLFCDHYQK